MRGDQDSAVTKRFAKFCGDHAKSRFVVEKIEYLGTREQVETGGQLLVDEIQWPKAIFVWFAQRFAARCNARSEMSEAVRRSTIGASIP